MHFHKRGFKHICFDTIYMCIWKSLFIFSVLCIAILLHHISNLGIVVFRLKQYTYSIIMLTILTFVLSRTKTCSIRVWSGFLFILQENICLNYTKQNKEDIVGIIRCQCIKGYWNKTMFGNNNKVQLFCINRFLSQDNSNLDFE